MITVGPGRTSPSDDEHAALHAELLAARAEVAQLEAAIASRDAIATAKGLLMAQECLNSDEAFEVLRRASQRENIRVRDIAVRMVRSHDERARKSVHQRPGVHP